MTLYFRRAHLNINKNKRKIVMSHYIEYYDAQVGNEVIEQVYAWVSISERIRRDS